MVPAVRTIDKRKESVNDIEKAEEMISLFRVFFIWISLRAIISTYNAEALILPAVDSTARSSITTIGSSMDFKKGTCSGFVYALWK